MENNDALPEGWGATVLDEIGDWSTGGTPLRKNTSYFGGSVPWVKSGDLDDGRVTATEETLSNEGLENSAAKLLPIGTVTVALYGATIGKLGVLDIEAATNQACANCQVNQNVADRWFLFYYLLQQRKRLIDAGQGGTQPNLTNGIVRDWPVFLPPLAEQKRIVAKVEELLGRVGVARERLAKLPALLKRFRQSILAAACSGKLTEEWREGRVQPSTCNELDTVASQHKEEADAALAKLELPEIPRSWCWSTLQRVTEYQGGYAYQSKRFVTKSQNQVLRIGNVRQGYIDLDASPVFISDEDSEDTKRFQLQENDVLISMTGTRYKRDYGYVGLVPKSTLRLFVNQRVAKLRCMGSCLSEYIYFWLQTGIFRDCFFERETGNVNQGNVGATPLKLGPIALPILDEQQEIVRRVDALFALADKIEARVKVATARVEKSVQAILAKAFRGELVPTEAELARQEGRDYEPASVLLERIRQNRETASDKKVVRKRKVRKSSRKKG